MGITTQVWYGDSPDDLNKLYDVLENGTAGYASVTRPPPRTSEPNRLYSWEGFFNNEVNDAAMHHGWRLFHVDGFRVVRGKDFPRWTMFRQSAETGKYEMLVATIQRGTSTEQDADEEGWLNAFKQKGITTKVWRSDYPEDLAELYDILDNGTVGQDSITKLPSLATSPIPANFGIVLPNTIDLIEGDEMTTGDKASLRRMDPTNPNSAAFWKLMSQRGMDGVDVQKWALITHGIALMAHGSGVAHRARTPVGRTLYLGGEQQPGDRGFYSEDRLATLLAARGPALQRLLARLFRILANEGCAFNWREMAWFILNEGHNEEEAEQIRIGIALAYYQAERRGSRSSAE
jgi:CRISPR system Cascade subunit CasB